MIHGRVWNPDADHPCWGCGPFPKPGLGPAILCESCYAVAVEMFADKDYYNRMLIELRIRILGDPQARAREVAEMDAAEEIDSPRKITAALMVNLRADAEGSYPELLAFVVALESMLQPSA